MMNNEIKSEKIHKLFKCMKCNYKMIKLVKKEIYYLFKDESICKITCLPFLKSKCDACLKKTSHNVTVL